MKALLPFLIIASPAFAGEDLNVLERLKALQNRQIQSAAPYADEVASDLARIESVSDFLFGKDRSGQIVLFTRTTCPACAKAAQEFETLVRDLDIDARAYDADTVPVQEVMQILGLDLVPSYVMPDRMIRGHMPEFILRRYLAE